jgi:hypothetical protein
MPARALSVAEFHLRRVASLRLIAAKPLAGLEHDPSLGRVRLRIGAQIGALRCSRSVNGMPERRR